MRDTEDRHVLEVAVAGHADLLVTANMADFEMGDIERVGTGARIRLYPWPGRDAQIIAHPNQSRDWLRADTVPPPAKCLVAKSAKSGD